MNLIQLKERVALSSDFTPAERDLILAALNDEVVELMVGLAADTIAKKNAFMVDLIQALAPFAEAADWFDATQNYLDDDAVAEKEKHGLGVMRINVGHLRAAKKAIIALMPEEATRSPHA